MSIYPARNFRDSTKLIDSQMRKQPEPAGAPPQVARGYPSNLLRPPAPPPLPDVSTQLLMQHAVLTSLTDRPSALCSSSDSNGATSYSSDSGSSYSSCDTSSTSSTSSDY